MERWADQLSTSFSQHQHTHTDHLSSSVCRSTCWTVSLIPDISLEWARVWEKSWERVSHELSYLFLQAKTNNCIRAAITWWDLSTSSICCSHWLQQLLLLFLLKAGDKLMLGGKYWDLKSSLQATTRTRTKSKARLKPHPNSLQRFERGRVCSPATSPTRLQHPAGSKTASRVSP